MNNDDEPGKRAIQNQLQQQNKTKIPNKTQQMTPHINDNKQQNTRTSSLS